jgi:uncharacterized protein (TIGR02246 family)
MQTRLAPLGQPLRLWVLGMLVVPAVSPGHDGAEAACRALVEAYAYHRDQLDADAAARLFTDDAVLEIMGERYIGRDAIHRRLAGARGGPITRHMLSTIHIDRAGPDRAEGVSYVTIYQAPPADDPADVRADLRIIGEYHDRFELTADGWKIAARRFQPVMTP